MTSEWVTLCCKKCFKPKKFLQATAPPKYICNDCQKAYKEIQQQAQEGV